MTDADGLPLVVRTGPANQPDAALALEMLDAIPPCGGQKGRPRRRPRAFQGDGAYGIKGIVAAVVPRRVCSLLAPYGQARKGHGSGLGKTRYVVERSLSWMGHFRRLKLCYERFGKRLEPQIPLPSGTHPAHIPAGRPSMGIRHQCHCWVWAILSRQCLDRRIPDHLTLTTEVGTWEINRNEAQCTVNWQVTTADARGKLKRFYPVIESGNSAVASH